MHLRARNRQAAAHRNAMEMPRCYLRRRIQHLSCHKFRWYVCEHRDFYKELTLALTTLALLPAAESDYTPSVQRFPKERLSLEIDVILLRWQHDSSLNFKNISFLTTNISKHLIILGTPWLQLHNPLTSWSILEILKWSDYCLHNCVKGPQLTVSSTSIESPKTHVQENIPDVYSDFLKCLARLPYILITLMIVPSISSWALHHPGVEFNPFPYRSNGLWRNIWRKHFNRKTLNPLPHLLL